MSAREPLVPKSVAIWAHPGCIGPEDCVNVRRELGRASVENRRRISFRREFGSNRVLRLQKNGHHQCCLTRFRKGLIEFLSRQQVQPLKLRARMSTRLARTTLLPQWCSNGLPCKACTRHGKGKRTKDRAVLLLQVLVEPHSWHSLPVANGKTTAGYLFWMLDLRHALVAFWCASASRARLRLVQRLSFSGGGKVVLEAVRLKDLPAVVTPVADYSCGESHWGKGHCRL